MFPQPDDRAGSPSPTPAADAPQDEATRYPTPPPADDPATLAYPAATTYTPAARFGDNKTLKGEQGPGTRCGQVILVPAAALPPSPSAPEADSLSPEPGSLPDTLDTEGIQLPPRPLAGEAVQTQQPDPVTPPPPLPANADAIPGYDI